jgi:hypothetical protein
MVFEVIVKLRERDEESRDLLFVLGACTRVDGVRTLGGGGGYLRDVGDDERVASICFQKNDDATGNLVDVTEPDREQVRRALALDSRVEGYLVGPILQDDASDGEPDLVRRFRAGERG